jgi:hypothetical protein
VFFNLNLFQVLKKTQKIATNNKSGEEERRSQLQVTPKSAILAEIHKIPTVGLHNEADFVKLFVV